jgi:regulatory protein
VALDDDDERAAAERLVARRLPSVQGLERQRAVSRLMGMLARKGYPPGMAGEVVRAALADGAADPSV